MSMSTLDQPLMSDDFYHLSGDNVQGSSYMKKSALAILTAGALAALGAVAFSGNSDTPIQMQDSDAISMGHSWYEVKNEEGLWGSFESSWTKCERNKAVCAISMKAESYQGGGDDTAANGLAFKCCDIDNWNSLGSKKKAAPPSNAPNGGKGWGSGEDDFTWCDSGKYVTDLSVKFEPKGGKNGNGGSKFDDTAVNGLKMRCRQRKHWGNSQTKTVEDGKFGVWRPWSVNNSNLSSTNRGDKRDYFMTAARTRWDTCTRCDDTALNGIYTKITYFSPPRDTNITKIRGKWINVGSQAANSGGLSMTLTKSVSNSSGSTMSSSQSSEYSVSRGASVSVGVEAAGFSFGAEVTYQATSSQARSVQNSISNQLSHGTSTSCSKTCNPDPNGARMYMWQWQADAITSTDKLSMLTCHFECSTKTVTKGNAQYPKPPKGVPGF